MHAEKAILTTAECGDYCGREIIFEELLAVYGHRILKPLRTLGNGSQTWSRTVVLATIALAQAEGKLNDRPLVEAALKQYRCKERSLKLQAAGS